METMWNNLRFSTGHAHWPKIGQSLRELTGIPSINPDRIFTGSPAQIAPGLVGS